jgi:hypothetical protein
MNQNTIPLEPTPHGEHGRTTDTGSKPEVNRKFMVSLSNHNQLITNTHVRKKIKPENRKQLKNFTLREPFALITKRTNNNDLCAFAPPRLNFRHRKQTGSKSEVYGELVEPQPIDYQHPCAKKNKTGKPEVGCSTTLRNAFACFKTQ